MQGRSRLLFYQDAPQDTIAGGDYLYSSFARPQRMSRLGGVTADSSTTISADTLTEGGNRGPFGMMGAKDILRFYSGPPHGGAGTVTTRQVASVTNNGAVVVDTLLTLSHVTSWDWQKASRGLKSSTSPLGSTLGWVDVAHWVKRTIQVQIITLPTGGFQLIVETRDPENQLPSVYTTLQFTDAMAGIQTFDVTASVASLRCGIVAIDTPGLNNGSITVTISDSDIAPVEM